ncbi:MULTISPECIES: HugZ family protein [unclassified Rhizobium]|uniref:HugZ family pyridoxamine 5'-phosphate oxidase n=1 Tax=unclassified Rhizobium TaxID=2613769 RepID=UPI0007005D7E|nr:MULTISPECIES: HugZ family protein [unclassified Rhizobium]KQV38242.1 pyridoxamine 5'-phosphate oxidase [Rhizobium sp. Root1212]KRD30899.1 pyridoxamine 5'-phosphate oxidase [Rhizobium sp. Root268]
MTDKPSVLRDTDDEARKLARTLLRSARSAALAVLEPGENGFPFVSRALIGIDIDGTPVILISKLSTHTQALTLDNRCSLLVGEIGKGDPLAHARMTVQCLAEKVERDDTRHLRLRERFLRRHPKAELYVDFPDFAFFRLTPQRASLNGGFGRAYALDGPDLMITSPAIADLVAMEGRAIDHMNSDHADAATRYAQTFCKATEEGWTITGIDAAGLDLSLGDKLKRLEFEQPLQSAAELRPLLVRLYG